MIKTFENFVGVGDEEPEELQDVLRHTRARNQGDF